jgi:hypothetical protein
VLTAIAGAASAIDSARNLIFIDMLLVKELLIGPSHPSLSIGFDRFF